MKPFILAASFIILLLGSSSGLYYHYIKDSAFKKIDSSKQWLTVSTTHLAQETIVNNDFTSFQSTIQALQQTTILRDVQLVIKHLFFDDKTLLKKISLSHEAWMVSDVTLDILDGEIRITNNGKYELILSQHSQNAESVNIKFQIIKDGVIKDFMIPLQLKKTISATSKTDQNFALEEINENDFSLSLSFDTTLNEEILKEQLYHYLLFFICIGGLFTFLSYFVYRYFIRNSLIYSVNELNKYITSILDGKMVKDSSVTVTFKELKELHANTLELTKKFVNTSNELSISRDIIFQKERSDELTGLPNKKSFENDLKYLFISNKSGYVIYLKMHKIGLFTKNYGPEIVDSLIESFAQSIQHYFNTNKNRNGTIYRFFGGEFAILLYDTIASNVNSFLKEIIALTETLSEQYYFFDHAIYYGATPVDHYGTIESIIQSAQEAYEIAFKEKSKFYFIVDAENQAELNEKLETTVRDIIKRNDFVLQYLHDTFNFDSSPKLIMQEVSPLLIDSFTYESIPKDKFISVAEKIGIITEFDKMLILKTLEQIELGELTHRICIVLSISSITNRSFISWLETTIEENKLMKSIVFASVCYSVASNHESFKYLSVCWHSTVLK
ncbi:MAG: diguanylate cyclase [Sulfurospirillaceae bacterium]|nr:diguanylate cyclase [Sulfurospirillaceae bacterium]